MEPELPCVACGSHLDSVPQGGNYDGAAGVVAGLAVLAGFVADGFTPRRTIQLFALRGEESSRFGKACLGSNALLGRLSAADLATVDSGGATLAACMRDVGADVDRIARREPLLDKGGMSAWLELHIEQGPVLLARQAPVAIVTGLRGNIRHRAVVCRGEPGHSGAIPRALRRDALVATADLITRLDRHWRAFLDDGRDLVTTCGMLGTDPAEHAITRIPGIVRFSFEVRSEDTATMQAFYDLFRSECDAVAQDRVVAFELDRLVRAAPAVMDAALVDLLRQAARNHGLPDGTMPSGAGHDAGMFANAGIPSGMIFVRNAHGSHNPREAMDMADFVAGVAVLRAGVRALSA